MDELLQYLKSDSYNESELEQILNKKIVITKNHIENINIGNYRDYLEFNIINLFEKYGYVFTNNDCIMLVNKYGYILDDIPEDIKTNEICEIAVKKHWYALEFVPNDKKTDYICRIAVEKHAYALQHVPENKKTNELCKIAVENRGYALKFVPEFPINGEFCKKPRIRGLFPKIKKQMNYVK